MFSGGKNLPHLSGNHRLHARVSVVLASIAAPADGMANNMFSCDNGYIEYSVGFVTLGSRRFNISLAINVAEILIIS